MGDFLYICIMGRKYTDEFILERGSNYDHPMQFKKHEKNVYSAGQKRKILDQIKYKIGYVGNRLKRMVYVYEFSDKSVYVGLTYNESKRKSEHLSLRRTSVSKHIEKTGLQPEYTNVTNGYIDANEAAVLEESLRLKYKLNGWNILNKKKGGGLGGNTIKWTVDMIKEAADKCKTREEFKDNYPGAVNASKQKEIYDEITKHMDYQLKYFTIEDIIKEAKKYDTIQKFRDNNETMYHHVNRNKLEDVVYDHMVNGRCEYVLDLETGIFYLGVKEAYESKCFKFKQDTLNCYLNGKRKNKTLLVRV
jgi:predicted GIY-YIG superfamily endonuclease